MQSSSLIQTLSDRLTELAQRIDSSDADAIAQSRFDHRLFQCRGTTLRDYLTDSQRTLRQLTEAAEQARTEQVAWLAQRLVDQITALAREIATGNLRRRPPAEQPTDPYARLAQHQDYARRLTNLIRDRESLLRDAGNPVRQQQLQREIAALEGRLARCRQALTRLEQQIERDDSGAAG
ncbi:primosomal replication protein PriC [Martelella alba]|uniref:Prepilin peptidase n=1 Tax=Martelella alba TaxID=2590451 RepID=A0ABY2SKU7_9HYPH|nr:primosomal replication protein [Martelella alba]TKI06257.1 prepilin peptidase [Martelella alba]